MSKSRFGGGHADRRMREYIYPNIAAWMNRNGITAVKLADLLGMNHTTVSEGLKGNREPRMQLIRGILHLSGMTFDEAFALKEPQSERRKESA